MAVLAKRFGLKCRGRLAFASQPRSNYSGQELREMVAEAADCTGEVLRRFLQTGTETRRHKNPKNSSACISVGQCSSPAQSYKLQALHCKFQFVTKEGDFQGEAAGSVGRKKPCGFPFQETCCCYCY